MKVDTDDVRYLIFEGGGGKGIAYLGVAEALEKLGILTYDNGKLDTNKIYGLAGTSVGSITATLLACGYNSRQLDYIINDDLGSKILDTVKYEIKPTIYTPEFGDHVFYSKKARAEIEEEYEEAKNDESIFKEMLKKPTELVKNFNYRFFSQLFKWYIDYEEKKEKKEKEKVKGDEKEKKEEKDKDANLEFLPTIKDVFHNKTMKTATDIILSSSLDASNSLKYDFGLFLGAEFRKTIDALIQKKTGRYNCTFREFKEILDVDLVLTGFDLTTNQLLYFRDNERFKDLCVADAVRMSISIPLVFKPVLANSENGNFKHYMQQTEFPSTIVDGGVGNNFPLRVFNDKKDKLNPNVLGFTLEPNYFSDSKSTLLGFLESVFLSLIKRTTHLQIYTDGERDQVIELDTHEVRILDFAFDKLPPAVNKAKKKTLEYFE